MATSLVSTGVQFPDATTQTTAASGIPPTQQIFTSSGTWTRPTSCKKIFVRLVGGGGNGNSFYGASGGYSQEFIDVTSISTVTVTIGAGAALGSSNGGTTSFGAYLSATGGTGQSASGLGSGGDLNLRGYAQVQANTTSYVRSSGSTPLGVGSLIQSSTNIAASGYGGGGFDVSGFTAASGVVFVTEYY
jgi:hypothetical protein